MNTTYWFARGYFDGRQRGEIDLPLNEHLQSEDWDAYDRGYEVGVSDYCRFDIVEEI